MTGPAPPSAFDETFQADLLELFRWRRDVRRFRPDPLPAGTLERLVRIACLAPSVGLSQPWRFVAVDDPARRAGIRACFEAANAEARATYSGERQARYAGLKLAGLDEAPVQFALFVDREPRQGERLGRLTMPSVLDYSAVLALGTLWLAARAGGIGLGWVSILDPARVAELLDVPSAWALVGYFCLGYPRSDEEVPELEREGWESRCDPESVLLRR